MTSTAFLLKNAEIINEGQIFKADLYINNGLIERIFHGGHDNQFNETEHKVFDLEGMLLMPGVIDDQVHFREPGLTHKADLTTESRAAVAGGITSFMEMPNTLPQTTTQELLEKKFQAGAKKSLANYSFYIGATNTNNEELRATDPQNVCGIKVFMGSSTGNMLVDDPAALTNIFRGAKLPVAVHCEDEKTVAANMKLANDMFGNDIPPFMHAVIRSHEACEISTRKAIGLAEKYQTRLHLLHLSTGNEVRLLRNDILLRDKQITAEVCVHHLWFSADDYAKKGNMIKWNPAVKSEYDRNALIDAIRDGYLDVIATDHAPHTLAEKQQSYSNCPSGGPMVQHALPAMLTLAARHNIALGKIVEMMCHNPAVCFNVSNRGFIREGYAADLVVINPAMKLHVTNENVLYKCGWSPLEGESFDYAVEYTFVNGNIVYKNGEIIEGSTGEALVFSR